MKPKNLFLMCGRPGSGKSTYVAAHAQANDMVVSRDAIRFSLLKAEEDYFSHEDEVVEIFFDTIGQALTNPSIDNIYVDATHLTRKSRNGVLSKLNLSNENVICVCFDIPLRVAMERNEMREGRALVPRSVMRRMDISFERPTLDEPFITKIIFVDENNNEEVVE